MNTQEAFNLVMLAIDPRRTPNFILEAAEVVREALEWQPMSTAQQNKERRRWIVSDTDDQYTCPRCSGTNKIKVKDRMEAFGSMIETECETTCSKCGHENYWAYGYYYIDARNKHLMKLRILLLPIVAALELISFVLTLVIQLFSIQAAQEIVKFWEGMPDNDWYLEGWK